MRGGYHISVKMVEQYRKDASGKLHLVERYHEASSPQGRLHTTCGHKHSSYDEATACIPGVELAYRRKRWPNSVASVA